MMPEILKKEILIGGAMHTVGSTLCPHCIRPSIVHSAYIGDTEEKCNGLLHFYKGLKYGRTIAKCEECHSLLTELEGKDNV